MNDSWELPEEIDYLDKVGPRYEDSIRRVDIENFIFSLTLMESMALVFLALGDKRKDIAKRMGYRNVTTISKLVLRMRVLVEKEQF
jgi:hypothetical protein